MRMNRAAFLLILGSILLASCGTLPPWKPVPSGQSVVYGQMEDSNRSFAFIAFSDDPQIIAIMVESHLGGYTPRYAMLLDKPARSAMREAIAKYQQWSRLAEDSQVDITREITTVNVPQMFRRGEGWEAEGSRDVTFVFRSRVEDSETPRISLIMRTRSLFYGMDQVVLSDQQADDFRNFLSDEQVTAAYRQAKEKQDTLDMFK